MNITATSERIVLPNQTRKSVIYKDEKGHKYIRKQGKYVKLQKGAAGFPITGIECACCINTCIFGGMGAVAGITAFVIVLCILNNCYRQPSSRRIQPVSSTPRPLAPLQQQPMSRRTAFTTRDITATIDLDAVNSLVNDPDVIDVLQQQTGADTTGLEEKLKNVFGGTEEFNNLKKLLMSPGQIMLGVGVKENTIIINPPTAENLVSLLNISGTKIEETPIKESTSAQIPSLATSIANRIKGLFDTSQCKVHPSTSYSSGGKSKPKKSKSK